MLCAPLLISLSPRAPLQVIKEVPGPVREVIKYVDRVVVKEVSIDARGTICVT